LVIKRFYKGVIIMNLDEIIRGRKSIRKFKNQEVPPEDLKKFLIQLDFLLLGAIISHGVLSLCPIKRL